MSYFMLFWLICGAINFIMFVVLKHKKFYVSIRESEHLDLDGEEEDVEAVIRIVLTLAYTILLIVNLGLGTIGLLLRLGGLIYQKAK